MILGNFHHPFGGYIAIVFFKESPFVLFVQALVPKLQDRVRLWSGSSGGPQVDEFNIGLIVTIFELHWIEFNMG